VARVLVIDDDEVFVDLMVHALQERGHDVAFALDGQAGCTAFASATFDVVVCDLVMPEQEGLETIRRIRRESSSVAILAVSGGMARAPQIDVLHIARQFGADLTLSKPFKLSQLLAAVDNALASRALVHCQDVEASNRSAR
jgi:DNA-binding response OmpR family regulator